MNIGHEIGKEQKYIMENNNYVLDLIFNRVKFNFDTISDNIEYISRMKDVPQSPVHHAEGDVWNHTKMVCEYLVADEEFISLNNDEKELVFCATLFHDIEKYSTTEVIGNKISAPNHSVKGAKTLFKYLKSLNVDSKKSFLISKLVRFHGLPLWLHEKYNSEQTTIESSITGSNKLLYILAKADANGRTCKDKDDLNYRVNFFKEYCKELNCYNTPFNFQSDLSRFEYFYHNKHYSYNPYDKYKDFYVYILGGLPGAGKDTYINNNLSHLPVISLDDIRIKLKIKARNKNQGLVIQTAKDEARTYLRKKESFIWNATNMSKLHRNVVIQLVTEYEAKIHIIWLDKQLDEVIKQNKEREDNKRVPELVIKKMYNKLEFPDLTECHKLTII